MNIFLTILIAVSSFAGVVNALDEKTNDVLRMCSTAIACVGIICMTLFVLFN